MSLAAHEDPPARAAVLAMQAALRSQGAAADAMSVVRAHIAAVRCGDPVLMSADYAETARIKRGTMVVVPREYFPSALQRMGSSVLVVHDLSQLSAGDQSSGALIVMHWALSGGAAHGTRGTDTFTVVGDLITHQQVDLHTPDF